MVTYSLARHREAYDRRRHGESIAQVAAALGVSGSRVGHMVRRWKKELKRMEDDPVLAAKEEQSRNPPPPPLCLFCGQQTVVLVRHEPGKLSSRTRRESDCYTAVVVCEHCNGPVPDELIVSDSYEEIAKQRAIEAYLRADVLSDRKQTS